MLPEPTNDSGETWNLGFETLKHAADLTRPRSQASRGSDQVATERSVGRADYRPAIPRCEQSFAPHTVPAGHDAVHGARGGRRHLPRIPVKRPDTCGPGGVIMHQPRIYSCFTGSLPPGVVFWRRRAPLEHRLSHSDS